MGTDAEKAAAPGWLVRILIGRDPRRTLVRVILWAGLTLLIGRYVLLPVRVAGISMEPTYRDRSVNFINCLAYLRHEPRRGDVIAIRYSGRSTMLLKRVVALPGETIAFHLGRIYINGNELSEPYVKSCNWEREAQVVGPDEYYVVGDNRTMEFGSHEQGCAPRQRIVGKALL